MAGGRLGRVALAAGALLTLAACDTWRCDFESHGACIEFATDPPDLEAARLRVDALLDRELPFWGLSSLGGWRIQFRDTANHPCYLASSSEGCTDYVEKTISVRVPATSAGCFEASELLHELGHYALGERGIDPLPQGVRFRVRRDGLELSGCAERVRRAVQGHHDRNVVSHHRPVLTAVGRRSARAPPRAAPRHCGFTLLPPATRRG